MPVIAIVPDHDCDLDTLYLSIALYLVHPRFSFVTVEAAIRPVEDCDAVTIALDGLPADERQHATLLQSANVRELLQMSQSSQVPVGRVWDFRDTFFDEDLHTNRGYEGPPEWRCIRRIRDNVRVEFVGQAAEVPHFTQTGFDVRTRLSTLRLSGAKLEGGRLSVMRLGFFLSRHELLPPRSQPRLQRLLERLAAYRPKTRFVTRFYSYRTADEAELHSLGVRARLAKTRVALTLAPFVTTPEQAGYRAEASSDLWVVAYGRGSLGLISPEVVLQQPSSSATWGLPTQRDEDLRSPFWDLHVRPGAYVTEWIGLPWVRPECDPRYEVRWEAELPGVSLRQFFVPTITTMAVAGFVLAATDDRWHPSILALALIVYLLLVALVIARNHHPAIRRFFERIKRS